MNSLVNYESDDENKDEACETAVTVMLDANYDDVCMDESDGDEESNNNVVEVIKEEAEAEAEVAPQDAPLVFRTLCHTSYTRDRDIVEAEALRVERAERRHSSDMEMDDDSDTDTDQQDVAINKTFLEPKQTLLFPKKPGPQFEDSKHENSHENHRQEGKTEDSETRETRTSRQDWGHKRRRSLTRRQHTSPKRRRAHLDGKSSSSSSPERCWKSTRLEKKAAALNRMGIEFRRDGISDKRRTGFSEGSTELPTAATAAALPSYYNPNVMSPLKYAQQIHKRKLLWSNKGQEKCSLKEAQAAVAGSSPWDGTTFKGDSDGKITEKFKRLMGIKSDGSALAGQQVSSCSSSSSDLMDKQQQMFDTMEAQYQVARMVTHTHRGVGLGYTRTPKHS